MATIKAVVLPHQQKTDGSYNVKIRVTHNRKSKYIPTTLVAYKRDLTSSMDIKANSALMFDCNRVIEPMIKALSSLGYKVMEEMSVAELVSYIEQKKAPFKLDFFVFADEYLSKKSVGSQRCYNWALNTFSAFLGKRECDINDITKSLILDLLSFIERTPKRIRTSDGMVSTKTQRNVASSQDACIKRLSTLHKAAKERFNDEDMGIIHIPKSPFAKIRLERVRRKGPESLSVEEMQRIITYKGALSKKQRLALDLFVLSFAFRGMNLADMFELKKPKREFVYYRKKTRTRRMDRAETRVLVPSCLDSFIERVSDKTDLIAKEFKGNNPYNFSSKVAAYIKAALSKVLGKELTFYAARDTFATLARNVCAVDSAMVDECLVHASKNNLLDVYVQKDWSLLHDAQKKVIALFSWQ